MDSDLRDCAHVLAHFASCNPVEPLAPQLEKVLKDLTEELRAFQELEEMYKEMLGPL